MATHAALVAKDCAITERIDDAISELNRRSGMPPLAVAHLPGRKNLTPLDVGRSEVTAALAEAVLRLSDQVADLRAELAARS